MTPVQKRDFIAEVVREKLLGPGYAKESYVCSQDASDEIITERPNLVYMTGILSPKSKNILSSLSALSSTQNGETSSSTITEDLFTEDNLFGNPPYDDIFQDKDTSSVSEDKEVTNTQKEEIATDIPDDINEDGGKVDDRADFAPSYIGLVTCLKEETISVQVDIQYGTYRMLNDADLKNRLVKVKWGRCSQAQIDAAFAYYDKYAATALALVGVQSIKDVFEIDTNNQIISPLTYLSYKDASNKEQYLHVSNFPRCAHNIVARAFLRVMEKHQPFDIKWNIDNGDFNQAMQEIDATPAVQNWLTANQKQSIGDLISYDPNTHIVSSVYAIAVPPDIQKCLMIDDPVRDELLAKLVTPHFFMRANHHIENYTLPIAANDPTKVSINEDLEGLWKVFIYEGKKYLRLLIRNAHIEEINNSGKKQTPTTNRLYQTIVRVTSPNIITYTEPHASGIDEEYELNEILYQDEKNYGKGVNCALNWEDSASPQWVETTYYPQQKVRKFSTQLKIGNNNLNNFLKVRDYSIWGLKDDEIITNLNQFADAYQTWHNQQMTQARGVANLTPVVNAQNEFLIRLKDNIDYLKTVPRAMQCFRIANTAMYVQMIMKHDPNFENKDRDLLSTYTQNFLYIGQSLLQYFQNGNSTITPTYYPFQLAFLVMNIQSTFDHTNTYCTDSVDLIWFPTGGGKTEAYLALTALTIAERRTSPLDGKGGVSVIMRYTLRLLTTQQIERASLLICAMEFLRTTALQDDLGNDHITLGMWVGSKVTPQKWTNKSDKYKRFFRDIQSTPPIFPAENPFPVSSCPLCGCNLLSQDCVSGYDSATGHLGCINTNCCFNGIGNLPILYIDADIYNAPPTMLIATVDKFAQITAPDAQKLFGIGTGNANSPDYRKPDLIIQDELHLISGPLGSMVGMFETMIEKLCTDADGRGPKIIASTATTRNTKHLVKELYNREVKIFPVSGVRYDDNFFSYAESIDNSKRLYVAISPTAHTAAELEIYTLSAELVARELLIKQELTTSGVNLLNQTDVLNAVATSNELKQDFDMYWSIVSYYTNLRSLGRTSSRVDQEIMNCVSAMRSFILHYPTLDFILNDFPSRTTELTSRQDSSRIKHLLVESCTPVTLNLSIPAVKGSKDLVLATNMISVGVDIDRWNVINMVGQPLTTAEYIQASSRVGRKNYGLVFSLYNPLRVRELSIYENHKAYHQVFYKYVEPLSIATFTEKTFYKLLRLIFESYMLLIKQYTRCNQITQADVDEFIQFISNRSASIDSISNAIFQPNMSRMVQDIYNNFYYGANRSIRMIGATNGYIKMQSLRDVESTTYLKYE